VGGSGVKRAEEQKKKNMAKQEEKKKKKKKKKNSKLENLLNTHSPRKHPHAPH